MPPPLLPQKKDITPAQGQTIVNEAAKWAGTPYALVGLASVRGVKGDCSGSTFYIYKQAGFLYPHADAANFGRTAISSGCFRKLSPTDAKQDGDILSWPDHMAIYSTFKNDPTNATTNRVNANGHPYTQQNDMWTAFNSHSSKPYGPFKFSYFKPSPPTVYRYQK